MRSGRRIRVFRLLLKMFKLGECVDDDRNRHSAFRAATGGAKSSRQLFFGASNVERISIRGLAAVVLRSSARRKRFCAPGRGNFGGADAISLRTGERRTAHPFD